VIVALARIFCSLFGTPTGEYLVLIDETYIMAQMYHLKHSRAVSRPAEQYVLMIEDSAGEADRYTGMMAMDLSWWSPLPADALIYGWANLI
jgi:hypothetical protein